MDSIEAAIDEPLSRLAREAFKVDYLYPLQRLVMANILDAAYNDCPIRQAAILPTGFGKSLCFQLPALLLPSSTLVVYPLLSLMSDQERRLRELGIPCASFRGGQETEDRRAAQEAIERGEAKIIITNPESLKGRLLDFLKEARPSHVAIDEAHCVSEWGEDFRPAYLGLGPALEKIGPPAATAFTATASPLVLESTARILFSGEAYTLVQGDLDRPNIHYSIVRGLARERCLEGLLRRLPRPAIVFCSSREGTQILAERLKRRLASEELRFYHAGLERGEKKAIEEWFYTSEEGILTATCAYGLGVDKKNIRTVIHYDPPASIEAYLQESGRGGRDGKQSFAVLLSGPEDEAFLARGAEKDETRRVRRQAMLGYSLSRGSCRRAALLALLGAELQGPCSGCDVCDGHEEEGFEGETEIRRLVAGNQRRFDQAEASRLLLGRPGEPPTCAGARGLASWREEDVAQAIRVATRQGLITVREKGLWKGRLLSSQGNKAGLGRREAPRQEGGAKSLSRLEPPHSASVQESARGESMERPRSTCSIKRSKKSATSMP